MLTLCNKLKVVKEVEKDMGQHKIIKDFNIGATRVKTSRSPETNYKTMWLNDSQC